MPRQTKTRQEPASAAAPRLHLVTGSDVGAIRERARDLVVEMCGGSDPVQDDSVETIVGDRDGVRPRAVMAEVLEALSSPPFFGPRKIVWLKNFDFAVAKKDERATELLEVLVERLDDGLPEDLALVISGPGVDGRSRFIKACKRLGAATVIALPNPQDRSYAESVHDLIATLSRERGIRLESQAVGFLFETVGGDPARVRHELDKLAAYVHPAERVTLADCRAICSRTPEAAAWAFADALGKRHLAEAFEALNLLMESRAEPVAVMGGVVNRFRQMLQARVAASALGIVPGCPYPAFKATVASPPPQIKAELGEHFLITAHPYRAWNILNEAGNFSEEELRQVFAHLVEASRRLVSGAMDQRLALEQLALKLCRR